MAAVRLAFADDKRLGRTRSIENSGRCQDQRAVLQTLVFLRAWFTGRIGLEPLPDGGLMTRRQDPAVWICHQHPVGRASRW